MVDVKRFQMILGEIEPLFGRMALYDYKKKCKLTEDFYFDMNSPEMLKLLEHEKVSFPRNFSVMTSSILSTSL